MPAGGGNLQRPLGAFLPLDVGEIGQVAGAVVHAGFRPRQNLRAAEMIGHGDQAARRQNVDIGPGPRRLRAAGMGADQPAPFGIGADRRRQRAGHRRDRAVQRKLAQYDIGRQHIAGDGAKRRHQAKRDRQIVMAAFLGQVRRCEIDRHLARRHRQSGGVKGRLHPLAAFGDRLVRQADDLHADLAGRDHHLHIDRHGLDALECNRTDPRNHAAPEAVAAHVRAIKSG